MDQNEWLRRYQEHLINNYHFSPKHAVELSNVLPFQDLSEGYEDDPEAAADMEMSYADSDFDLDDIDDIDDVEFNDPL